MSDHTSKEDADEVNNRDALLAGFGCCCLPTLMLSGLGELGALVGWW